MHEALIRLTHDLLKLEVTESAYTENAGQVIQVVENLRKKGYVVELDDFGTGYSSLNMLTAMPLDYLKMDRTFVQNMEHSERDAQLVDMILGTARGMNVPVIAEGVETEQQLKMLRERGCETGERNLDYYFDSVENAMGKVSRFVENDLDGLDDEKLAAHMARAEKFFEETAYKTNGVYTVMRRADKVMYESKRQRKVNRSA